ncbi:MAG: energy-coupled thiamine transporter ThiT [Clostridia bacterium]|nr:energy-coupled thiamine transporter ThiT [Clostridia bacterium]
MSEWFNDAFSKFGKISGVTWIALGVVVALGLVVLAVSKSKKKWTAKMIAFGALAIALSFVLSCVRLYRMPTGGSVTPGSMLPLMLFSVSFGMGPGLVAGLAYGLLQYLQGGWWLNVWQFLLDYLLAFTALGLAGIAHNKKDNWLYISIPVAALGRAVCAILAGLMWVADTPVEELTVGTMQFSSPLLYSIVYNGAYLVPDTLICLLLALLIAKPLVKIMKTK